MSRIVNQPIQVTSRPTRLARSPEPVSFVWRGTTYRVTKILETWEEAGRWWEQEPPATAWRVRVHSGGVMELVMLHTRPPQWRLYKIYD